MPNGAGRGVDHSSYTDHSIRIPGKSISPSAALHSFWPNAYNDRDLALAEAILGRWEAALPRLEAAVAANPKDLTAHSQLAQAYERIGANLSLPTPRRPASV
jgi:Flp pilus assembly protein TadD